MNQIPARARAISPSRAAWYWSDQAKDPSDCHSLRSAGVEVLFMVLHTRDCKVSADAVNTLKKGRQKHRTRKEEK